MSVDNCKHLLRRRQLRLNGRRWHSQGGSTGRQLVRLPTKIRISIQLLSATNTEASVNFFSAEYLQNSCYRMSLHLDGFCWDGPVFWECCAIICNAWEFCITQFGYFLDFFLAHLTAKHCDERRMLYSIECHWINHSSWWPWPLTFWSQNDLMVSKQNCPLHVP